ncbi:hypothetical protein L5515_013595 [Caenorhabditis briggsae]|uniref:Uncharacterized protein n=1 Tax=Caenorhabditis briggsae TaxID=6238 RepID=A0AAE9EBS3_CAEBR|nr:hypothetical protein L5515_013595 [Caenorhabditis briggsae]
MRRAEEAANVVDEDDQPPIIPRYDPPAAIQQQQIPIRQVYTGQQVVRAVPSAAGKGNVIFLKSSDGGTQKMLVRQAGKPEFSKKEGFAPGTVLTGGTRVVAVRQQGGQPIRQIYTGNSLQNSNSTRFVRVQQPQQQVLRRVVPQRAVFQEQQYVDPDGQTPPPPPPQRYIMQTTSGGPPKMPRTIVPRGGMTMQMVQQQQNNNPRRFVPARNKPRTAITYGDFLASRGYQDGSKFMMQTKPTFLPFEFNEEEEREINEAIAREEEWMRLEEEKKIGGFDASGNPVRSFSSANDPNRAAPYVSNLLPSINDTPDDKVIKQVLDVMFSQVCRWDRQYGWSKTHMKRARAKNDSDKIHLRKARLTQREIMISEHMERLKKEINKRRTKMENEAEQMCGLLTPWRKSRSRPHRKASAAKPKAEVKKEVINPADITLGGDTYDYEKEQKPTDSIASGVSRRRRTSANLSKSESEDKSDSQPRGNKERRTSQEPIPRVVYFSPGTAVPMEIDMAMSHCTCQQPFDANRFYVQCDMCARWYHGDCVNITEKMALKFEQWTCEQCIEEQERVKEQPALYCVCKKPYDDTKFYVGCDSCQGWFHPECVGTTREQAEQAADYNCPSCRDGYESEASEASVASRASVELTRADYCFVNELLELLNEHRMNTPFRTPVDLTEFPDYTQYVKKPIDLTIIGKKVHDLEYQYLGHFVNDVNLMFENAKTYNPKDSAIFKCAETIQEVFDKKLMAVREQMTANQQMLLFQQNHHDPMSTARKRVQSESQKTVDSLDIDPDQLLPFDPSVMMYFGYQ